MTTSAPSTASTLDDTVRIPCVVASAVRRSARGWLATIWPGSTSLPLSRPKIIASAMTPEPTVAMVLFARGDIGPEDTTAIRPVTRRSRPA